MTDIPEIETMNDDRPILIRIQEQLDDIALPRAIYDVLSDAAYMIEEYERRLAGTPCNAEALESLEALANMPLGISLADWSRLSSPILAALTHANSSHPSESSEDFSHDFDEHDCGEDICVCKGSYR